MINDAVRGYFGFERLPFDRSIPVGALFASASHQEAAGRIGYGIDTRQITVITGEVGAGKTVAARAAVARLDASRYQLITIPNPQVGARGIHHAVVAALGGVPRVHHATLIPQAAGHLAAELAERGRLPVLLIDEAHLLSHDQLEAIRMLTSAQLDSASPLAVLLLGQPQLRASMRLGVLAALDQRIGVRYAMAPMTPDETGAYLRHHTKLAGRADTLFSDDAAGLIHQASRGYPRAVNRLAAAALLATYTTRKTIADTTAVRAAITEVNDQ
jgi:type II secretory pathway predicted ATPase ExeA